MEEFKHYLDKQNTKAVVIMRIYENERQVGEIVYADFIPYDFDILRTKELATDIFKEFLQSNSQGIDLDYKSQSILCYDENEYSLYYLTAENQGYPLCPMFEISSIRYRCYVLDKSRFNDRDVKLFENWGQTFGNEFEKHENNITIITEDDIREFIDEYMCQDLVGLVSEYVGNIWYFGETNYIVFSTCGDIQTDIQNQNQNDGDNTTYLEELSFFDGYCCLDLVSGNTIRSEFEKLTLQSVGDTQSVFDIEIGGNTIGDTLFHIINLRDFSVH
jgi:hypothetical protein